MEKIAKKILILEDEKPLARALELKLTHEGYIVKSFQSGEGVISLLSKEEFDLLICDLVMPHIDGFQILENIKEKNIKISRIIVLTNLSQIEDEKRARSLGATEFFVKSNTPLSKIVDYVKKTFLN